ncbi:unnamed protein product, partial [Symbiodinium pilosum]
MAAEPSEAASEGDNAALEETEADQDEAVAKETNAEMAAQAASDDAIPQADPEVAKEKRRVAEEAPMGAEPSEAVSEEEDAEMATEDVHSASSFAMQQAEQKAAEDELPWHHHKVSCQISLPEVLEETAAELFQEAGIEAMEQFFHTKHGVQLRIAPRPWTGTLDGVWFKVDKALQADLLNVIREICKDQPKSASQICFKFSAEVPAEREHAAHGGEAEAAQAVSEEEDAEMATEAVHSASSFAMQQAEQKAAE